jgi:hypothetical protein
MVNYAINILWLENIHIFTKTFFRLISMFLISGGSISSEIQIKQTFNEEEKKK